MHRAEDEECPRVGVVVVVVAVVRAVAVVVMILVWESRTSVASTNWCSEVTVDAWRVFDKKSYENKVRRMT